MCRENHNNYHCNWLTIEGDSLSVGYSFKNEALFLSSESYLIIIHMNCLIKPDIYWMQELSSNYIVDSTCWCCVIQKWTENKEK